jgi:hypothetical protein
MPDLQPGIAVDEAVLQENPKLISIADMMLVAPPWGEGQALAGCLSCQIGIAGSQQLSHRQQTVAGMTVRHIYLPGNIFKVFNNLEPSGKSSRHRSKRIKSQEKCLKPVTT